MAKQSRLRARIGRPSSRDFNAKGINQMLPPIKLLTFATTLVLFTVARPASDKLVLVAASGTGGDGSSATQARLEAPVGVDFDPGGNLYFVEMTANRVRKIDAKGIVTTIAGTGQKGDGGDGGPAVKAELNGPHHLAVGP